MAGMFLASKLCATICLKAYKSLSTTIKEGGRLNPEIADEVADAMKNWAISKGATIHALVSALNRATAENMFFY